MRERRFQTAGETVPAIRGVCTEHTAIADMLRVGVNQSGAPVMALSGEERFRKWPVFASSRARFRHFRVVRGGQPKGKAYQPSQLSGSMNSASFVTSK